MATFRRSSGVVLALCILLAPAVGVAGTLYETDFPDPTNSMPAGWSALVGPAGNPGWRIDTGGDFRYDGGPTGVAHYTGPVAVGSSTALADFTVSTELRKSAGPIAGVVGRVQNANTFYHARIRGGTALELYRFDSGSATKLGPTVTTSTSYSSGQTWRLATTFEGSTITARAYNQNGVLVGTASAVDATYASGSAGLRGQNPNAFELFKLKTPTVLAYEGFPTTAAGTGASYAADATVRGVDKPRGGFTGPWTSVGGFNSSVDAYARTAGLQYGDLTTTPGGLETFRASTSGPNAAVKYLRRNFNYSFDDEDEIWASFLFRYDGYGSGGDGSVFVVDLNRESANGRGAAIRIEQDGTVKLDGGGSTGSQENIGTAVAGETHLVVLQSAPSADGPNAYYDAVSVWLDPNLSDLGDPDAEGFAVMRYAYPNLGDLLTLNELEVRWRPNPPGFSFEFDEFRLGTGASAVLPVPEPATIALLGLAATGLAGYIRRRPRA